jgi:DNA polymerase elongation subunit (family B)
MWLFIGGIMDYVYDIETYPNCFTITIKSVEGGSPFQYQISEYKDERFSILHLLYWLRNNRHRMVGFNNINFDYPVIHYLINNSQATPLDLYNKAMEIINSDTPYKNQVWQTDHYVQQIDLFKIHHFDNKARYTSLKVLEFNMKSESIKDLPFPLGTMLNKEQVQLLIDYNLHDVEETIKFYHESKEMIEFREKLSIKYSKNFLNHNDTKIGKDYFIMQLEKANPGSCYVGRKPRQTIRSSINLKDCIFPYVQFQQPEFNRIKNWLSQQTITETKGMFKNLTCKVSGFEFVFGLGGIHGSVEFRELYGDDEYQIIDLDVTSYYPALAIVNRVYPEHLGETFCDIYKDVFEERKRYPKGTVENAVYKLALNGVYGDSNNPYSPFYDSKYTMTITINGQLLLCMLAEWLMRIPDLKMVQVNTDGVTVLCPRRYLDQLEVTKRAWEEFTLLKLEEAEYSRMFIRDVNNYIAEYTDGSIKRKGAYEHNREWHQNHSALVVPKAVESHLLHRTSIRNFIEGHDNIHDFMIRTKLPRKMKLVIQYGEEEYTLENTTRYYVTHDGGYLKKIMPPLPGETEERSRDIESGWRVTPCNDIADATDPINYEYYIQEAEKLILELH